MLGLTSYQEAFRALGTLLERVRGATFALSEPNGVNGATQDAAAQTLAGLPAHLLLVEDPARAALAITMDEHHQVMDAAQIEALVLSGRALRGLGAAASSPLSDLLRAVGYALDELRAYGVIVDLNAESIVVRFRSRDTAPDVEHNLTYAGDELTALRSAATARRKGDPLRRILILHSEGGASASIRELLVAEFAVEDLPTMYAPAIAQSGEPPHLVLVHLGNSVETAQRGLEAVRVLHTAERTAAMPIIAIAGAPCAVEAMDLFESGADDFLREPVAPAIMRARVRTWILRDKSNADGLRNTDTQAA